MVMRFAGMPDTAKLEAELRERLDRLIEIGQETNRLLERVLELQNKARENGGIHVR